MGPGVQHQAKQLDQGCGEDSPLLIPGSTWQSFWVDSVTDSRGQESSTQIPADEYGKERQKDALEQRAVDSMNFFSEQRAAGRGKKLKLNEDKVRMIRLDIAAGIPQRDIAAQFGVAKSTVSAIATRQIWGHVGDATQCP